MRNRELSEDILRQVSSLITTENAKQQEILSGILTEIKSLLQSSAASSNQSLHSSLPTIAIESCEQQNEDFC